VGDLIGSVPAAITDPDVRYLIASLAARLSAWDRMLGDPRDRHTLKRLYASDRRAFRAALEQESLQPTAKNPGAWLQHTVPLIAATLEAAS
jgi:hypothetical protein